MISQENRRAIASESAVLPTAVGPTSAMAGEIRVSLPAWRATVFTEIIIHLKKFLHSAARCGGMNSRGCACRGTAADYTLLFKISPPGPSPAFASAGAELISHRGHLCKKSKKSGFRTFYWFDKFKLSKPPRFGTLSGFIVHGAMLDFYNMVTKLRRSRNSPQTAAHCQRCTRSPAAPFAGPTNSG